jgi:hypothetical protein
LERQVRTVTVAFESLETSLDRLYASGWRLLAVIVVGPGTVQITVTSVP